MKALRIAHVVLTTLLVAGDAVFGFMLLVGVIEVRHSPSTAHSERTPSPKVDRAKARLLVVRGLQPNWEYPIYEGANILGRADDKPVDIDLQPQEPEDRIWSSRQHAAITWEGSAMVIEDLSSANGTYVNRSRVPPGERRALKEGDVIQVGAVQLKVLN